MGAFRRGVLLLAAALLFSSFGLAQNDSSLSGGNGGVQTGDVAFMKKAAQDGMAKFQLAYLALQNAKSEEVKAYARQVLADYYKSQGALIDLANQQFIALPTEPDAKDKATFEGLSQLQGDAFDKAYMKTTLNGHRTDLAQYKREAKSGNNSAIISWADQYLPALETQSKQAQKLAISVGLEPADKAKAKPDAAQPEAPASKPTAPATNPY
jgi:putative membrane protein